MRRPYYTNLENECQRGLGVLVQKSLVQNCIRFKNFLMEWLYCCINFEKLQYKKIQIKHLLPHTQIRKLQCL